MDAGERQALTDIENQLRRETPDLAGAFDDVADRRTTRRRLVWARRMIGFGVLVVVVGLVAQDGPLSLGALVLGYGALSVVAGSILFLRGHRPARPS